MKPPNLQLSNISFEQALDLFKLPKNLGTFRDKEILINNGRFGPYIKHGEKFISIPKDINPVNVELDQAIEFIKQREKADEPIYFFDGQPVTKGKGRFGPFIKWNNLFINVSKKYDWDNLSDENIEELIVEKIKKEKEKIVHNWVHEGIRVEKARWGRHNIIKGKIKIELSKNVDVKKFTLEDCTALINKESKKKVSKPKTSRK